MSAASAPRELDLQLARRCVAGDVQAQQQLFREQAGRIHLILYRILGSNRELEDLVQDAFIAVFRSLGSYRGEAALATWVDRITTRTAFAYLSRREHRPARLEVVDAGNCELGETPEQRLVSKEAARRLYAILDRLDAKYRIAYLLHVVDERPIAEVAELTEVSVIAAKNRVWRARRQVHARAKGDALLKDLLARWSGGGK